MHPSAVIAPGRAARRARLDRRRAAWSARACAIGDDSCLYPRVVVYPGCTLGARVIVHSGAVIGADGFGIARDERALGEDPADRRACASATTSRSAPTPPSTAARCDDTVIEDGVKLDNQIQIGHNVRIGAHTAIAGCAGIAGSADIGRHCMIGGAAMIVGHITIADDVHDLGRHR